MFSSTLHCGIHFSVACALLYSKRIRLSHLRTLYIIFNNKVYTAEIVGIRGPKEGKALRRHFPAPLESILAKDLVCFQSELNVVI